MTTWGNNKGHDAEALALQDMLRGLEGELVGIGIGAPAPVFALKTGGRVGLERKPGSKERRTRGNSVLVLVGLETTQAVFPD